MTGTWPNFFIAGVPRAGTTALYYYLWQHPQIYLSPIKEPTYFARSDHGRGIQATDAGAWDAHQAETRAFLASPMEIPRSGGMISDENDYLKLFANVRDETAIGEASTGYFWLPSAPRAIASAIPAARIIMILRDPADRMFSTYLASLAGDPRQTFRERFAAAMEPGTPWSLWLDVGRYATNLRRFFDVFPRTQMRFYLYEDYRSDPQGVLRDIFGFLGVDQDCPIALERRYNEPAVPRFPRLHWLRNRILGRKALAWGWPEPLRHAVRRLYNRPRATLDMHPADRQAVIEYFRDEVRDTETLIGRDLSAWLR